MTDNRQFNEGRPRRAGKKNSTKRIAFRLSAQELEVLESHATARKLSVSEFVRWHLRRWLTP